MKAFIFTITFALVFSALVLFAYSDSIFSKIVCVVFFIALNYSLIWNVKNYQVLVLKLEARENEF